MPAARRSPQTAIKAGMTVDDIAETWAPYLTMAESMRLVAQLFRNDLPTPTAADRAANGRSPALIVLALVCCAGHTFLGAFGTAGAAAGLAAVIGNWPVVAAGVVGVALAGSAVASQLRRPPARSSQHRAERERCRS